MVILCDYLAFTIPLREPRSDEGQGCLLAANSASDGPCSAVFEMKQPASLWTLTHIFTCTSLCVLVLSYPVLVPHELWN